MSAVSPDDPIAVLRRILALPPVLRETCVELIGPGRRTVRDLAERYGRASSTIYDRYRRARVEYGIPLPPLSNRGRPRAGGHQPSQN